MPRERQSDMLVILAVAQAISIDSGWVRREDAQVDAVEGKVSMRFSGPGPHPALR